MAPVDTVVDENSNVNELTELEEKIVTQIEYYFGDINVRRDKFLKEKIGEDSEGWVPIDVLLTFNRLKNLTPDPKVITSAIAKSSSDVVEVSADETKIKRIHPISDLTEEQLNQLHLRTVHFKGFPLDATLDAIKAFASQYGKVESVEMRKTRLEKTFKGCCMVVYSTLAEAEKAVEGKEIFTDAIPKFLRENKINYFKRKADYRRERLANRKKARFGTKNKTENKDNKDDAAKEAKDDETKKEETENGVKQEEVGVKVEVKVEKDCGGDAEDAEMKKDGDDEATDETGAGDNLRKRKHGGGGRGGGRGRGGKRFKKGRRGGYKGGHRNNRNKTSS